MISEQDDRMRRPLVSAVVGTALLGGCTAAEPKAAPVTTTAISSTSEVTTLTCARAIDGGPPPSGYATVLDVVALPTRDALGASDSGDPTTPALFAETGLLVRAGRSFDLVVAPQPDNDVAIGWSNRSFRPGPRFTVPPCPDTYGTGWLAYPGGYWADRPLCLPLTVRADGREEQVHVGVGTACPGQAPPPSP
jgi:hypothetical protein